MKLEQLTMNSLFAQLGLASSDRAIMAFIHAHAPLLPTLPLHEFHVWNEGQATFIRQAITDDADWCAVVDQLDARLRQHLSE